MNEPTNVRIAHPDGTETPVELVFIGTEPMALEGDVYIIDRWQITTETFMAEGDRLVGEIPENYSIVTRQVGMR